MSDKITNVLVVGVGGQGIILAGEILSMVALNAGFDVKKSEVHGMAQRGGSVNSQVRFGKEVHSPLIPKGEVDILLSFEKVETLRWAPFCNKKTVALVNAQKIHSLTTATSLQEYPEGVEAEIRNRFSKLFYLPSHEIADELGNRRVMNVVLLGLLAKQLKFPEAAWTDALKLRLKSKPDLIDLNMQAFRKGFEFA